MEECKIPNKDSGAFNHNYSKQWKKNKFNAKKQQKNIKKKKNKKAKLHELEKQQNSTTSLNNNGNLNLIWDFSDNYRSNSRSTRLSSANAVTSTSSSSVAGFSKEKRNMIQNHIKPDKHQLPVTKLIKEEPIVIKEEPSDSTEDQSNDEVEILDNLVTLSTDDEEQDQFHYQSIPNRVLLLNPMFYHCKRLNRATGQDVNRNETVNIFEPWERETSRNVAVAAEPQKRSTGSTMDSSVFYIDVDNIAESARSPYSPTLDTPTATIMNIKQELDDNYQNNPSTNTRNQQELNSASNNEGNLFCRHCKINFMNSNQLITHLESLIQNPQQKKKAKKTKSQTKAKQVSNTRQPVAPENSIYQKQPSEPATSFAKSISIPNISNWKELRVIIPKLEIISDKETDSDSSVVYLEPRTKTKKTPSAIASTSSARTRSSYNLRKSSQRKSNSKHSQMTYNDDSSDSDSSVGYLETRTASKKPTPSAIASTTSAQTKSSYNLRNSSQRKPSVNSLIDDTYEEVDKPLHACTFCGKAFKYACILKIHLVKHSGERPFKCENCHKTFTRQSNLCTHRKMHLQADFQCKYCGKHFGKKFKLDRHLASRVCLKEPFKCGQCGLMFTTREILLAHIKRHIREKPYLSPKNKNTSQAIQQQRTQKGNQQKSTMKCRRFRCSYCTKPFKSRQIMISHEMIHRGEKPFPCTICGKNFRQSAHVKNHIATVHSTRNNKSYKINDCVSNQNQRVARLEDNRFYCTHCPKSFVKRWHLVIHKRRYTGEKRYACKYCTMRFVTSTELTSHTRYHTGEKPFACSHCSSRFTEKKSMEKHVKTHADGKYECQTCRCKFSSVQGLSHHKKHHNNNSLPIKQPKIQATKSLSCNLCHKKFKEARRLRIHLTMTHTNKSEESRFIASNKEIHLRRYPGEKPHACEYCPMRFVTRTGLISHARSHTGEKLNALSYPHCSSGFKLQQAFTRHKLVHSKNTEGEYQCKICKSGFLSAPGLRQHQKTVCIVK